MRTNSDSADHLRATGKLPWDLGQGSTDDLLDFAYERSVNMSADFGTGLARIHVGGTWAGFVDPVSCDFVRWPAVTMEEKQWTEADWMAELHGEADRCSSRAICYFIGGDDGAIKIGYSIDVKSRLSAIQSCCPIRLRVLATAPGGLTREGAYHYQFHAHRLHGEWFNRVPEIEAEITRLNIQTQTIAQSGVGG